MDDLTRALKAAGDDTLREQAAAFAPSIAHGQRPDERDFEAAHAASFVVMESDTDELERVARSVAAARRFERKA